MKTRAADDDEIRLFQQFFRRPPGSDVLEGVHADNEVQAVGFLELLLQSPHGVDRVGRPSIKSFERLDVRSHEGFFPGSGERDHGITVRKRRQRLFLLVRRRAGGREKNPAKVKTLLCGAGNRKVSAMDGIESAAEQSDVHSVQTVHGHQFPVFSLRLQDESLDVARRLAGNVGRGVGTGALARSSRAEFDRGDCRRRQAPENIPQPVPMRTPNSALSTGLTLIARLALPSNSAVLRHPRSLADALRP